MKQPSFIQSLYYQQGVAQQPNDCTRQTPPRTKRPRGHRLSSVAQRCCLDRPTVPIFPTLKNTLFFCYRHVRLKSAVVLQPNHAYDHIPSFGEDRPSAGPQPCTSAKRGPRLRAVGKSIQLPGVISLGWGLIRLRHSFIPLRSPSPITGVIWALKCPRGR